MMLRNKELSILTIMEYIINYIKYYGVKQSSLQSIFKNYVETGTIERKKGFQIS